MELLRKLLEQCKVDYDFKTTVGVGGSTLLTLAFALYNGFLGIRTGALWYITIGIYYIILMFLRSLIIITEKRIFTEKKGDGYRNKAYVTAAFILVLLDTTLILPISMMVEGQKPVEMTLTPAIIMAAYTVQKIVRASINLWASRKKTENNLTRLITTIAFIDSLVSILVLQNTLVMIKSQGPGPDDTMHSVMAASSGIIFLAIMLLSVFSLLGGIRILMKNGK